MSFIRYLITVSLGVAEMILVWKDAKSFNRHLENMRHFRELHRTNAKCAWNIIKDMPVLYNVRIPADAGGARVFSDVTGPMVVPLWKITLPMSLKN